MRSVRMYVCQMRESESSKKNIWTIGFYLRRMEIDSIETYSYSLCSNGLAATFSVVSPNELNRSWFFYHLYSKTSHDTIRYATIRYVCMVVSVCVYMNSAHDQARRDDTIHNAIGCVQLFVADISEYHQYCISNECVMYVCLSVWVHVHERNHLCCIAVCVCLTDNIPYIHTLVSYFFGVLCLWVCILLLGNIILCLFVYIYIYIHFNIVWSEQIHIH